MRTWNRHIGQAKPFGFLRAQSIHIRVYDLHNRAIASEGRIARNCDKISLLTPKYVEAVIYDSHRPMWPTPRDWRLDPPMTLGGLPVIDPKAPMFRSRPIAVGLRPAENVQSIAPELHCRCVPGLW